jgi:MerR family transcriptional regulator, light-induced transcriptional regulator
VLSGKAISQVAPLDLSALAGLVKSDSSGSGVESLPDDDTPRLARALDECRAAVERIDGPALERALRRAAHQFSVPVLLDHLLVPLLRAIGERWESGELQVIHEHAASVEIHRLLTWIVVSAPIAEDAPLIAVATPSGQQMELGALMVAATAAAEGWRVAWFGPNLPAADIIHGVESRRPAVLAISLVHQTRDAALHRELLSIAEGVAGKAVLLVGGRAAPAHALLMERLGAIVMQDLMPLRSWLRNYRHVP